MHSQQGNSATHFSTRLDRTRLATILMVLTLGSFSAHATVNSRNSNDFSTEVYGFKSDYLRVALLQNSPTNKTENNFYAGVPTYLIGYQHFSDHRWLMGITVGFKDFIQKQDNSHLGFFTIGEEASYMVRLYHPAYLTLGGKAMYLYPTNGPNVPFVRNQTYSMEIGAAISLALITHFTQDTFASFEVNSWRGTNTSLFHGIETSCGLSRGF